ncbi:D-alanine--D-alanine ligase family protein [Rubrivirga sp.]|uniref:D-alanine--D-alanine ligase family protein n=1 Tax=Rubrivirga sp. TaxID=1885344 RepID=UPI003C72C44C
MSGLHVGLVYGGQSPEHEVSILSARNVRTALEGRHRVTPIYIDRDGQWSVLEQGADLEGATGAPARFTSRGIEGVDLDVVFPVLHGPNGEDGTVQGFLQTLGLPFVGPDVLGSSVCMDKATAKRLLRDAGLPGVPFAVVRTHDRDAFSFDRLSEKLGSPLFVKPANAGSSVGVSRVQDAAGLEDALTLAFQYDRTALVEQFVDGREIEVAVLGNENPQASIPGEIVSTAEFYTYDAKYQDPEASRMEVPADLEDGMASRLHELAVRAYAALGCEGMARVDFFVTADGDAFVNEINTIPGFTARSMYPVMWEKTGRSQEQLMDDLLQLALDRHERDSARRFTRL